MSLYFTLLFAVLTIEMVYLFVLVLPLPNRMRKMIYQSYNTLSKKQEVRTVVVVLAIIVGLLFVDSWKRAQINVNLYRHQRYAVNEQDKRPYDTTAVTPIQALASRAYNQRNVYISGFILYFMIGIVTVMSIVRRLTKYQDLINEKKKESKTEAKKEQTEEEKEISKLEKDLKATETDLEALKTQIKNFEKFYDESNKSTITDDKDVKESKKL